MVVTNRELKDQIGERQTLPASKPKFNSLSSSPSMQTRLRGKSTNVLTKKNEIFPFKTTSVQMKSQMGALLGLRRSANSSLSRSTKKF